MTSGGAHRIVDRRDSECADRVPLSLDEVHLGDLFFQRAASHDNAERITFEFTGLFVNARGTTVLALVVTPDAVIGLIECAFDAGARIGQLKTFARAQPRLWKAQRSDAAGGCGLDRHQVRRLDLVRNFEQHSAPVPALALRTVGRQAA